MSFHRDNSLKDHAPNPTFWEYFRPKSEQGRSMLYRYEGDSIVVYDNTARVSTEPAQVVTPVNREVPNQIKKEIDQAPDYGKFHIDKIQYLNMKHFTQERQYTQEYTLVIPKDKTLTFDSKFESGNLHKAAKLNENEYNLWIDFDTETKGYTQWYYFSVKNYKAGHRVRFNLVNLMKYESLYNAGMKPLVYSTHRFQTEGVDWHREGSAISYYQNSTKREFLLPNSKNSRFFYTLSFTYTFVSPNDTVFFAHCYPYTYTDLTTYLSHITSVPSNKSFLRVNCLCKTLAGNSCPVITITRNISTYTPWEEESVKLSKSAAGRRVLKMREFKEEAKLKVFEFVNNIKVLEGKS